MTKDVGGKTGNQNKYEFTGQPNAINIKKQNFRQKFISAILEIV